MTQAVHDGAPVLRPHGLGPECCQHGADFALAGDERRLDGVGAMSKVGLRQQAVARHGMHGAAEAAVLEEQALVDHGEAGADEEHVGIGRQALPPGIGPGVVHDEG